jgi:hypothetical protein
MIVIELFGPGEVSVETPFNRQFVEDLKTILKGRNIRRWDPVRKAWIVRTAAFNRVHELIDDYYPSDDWAVSPEAQAEIQKGYKESVDYGVKGYAPPGAAATGGPPASYGPYATLYLNDSAPDCVVQAAHKALARMHHPDVGGDRDAMARVNAAFEEIKKLRGM